MSVQICARINCTQSKHLLPEVTHECMGVKDNKEKKKKCESSFDCYSRILNA